MNRSKKRIKKMTKLAKKSKTHQRAMRQSKRRKKTMLQSKKKKKTMLRSKRKKKTLKKRNYKRMKGGARSMKGRLMQHQDRGPTLNKQTLEDEVRKGNMTMAQMEAVQAYVDAGVTGDWSVEGWAEELTRNRVDPHELSQVLGGAKLKAAEDKADQAQLYEDAAAAQVKLNESPKSTRGLPAEKRLSEICREFGLPEHCSETEAYDALQKARCVRLGLPPTCLEGALMDEPGDRLRLGKEPEGQERLEAEAIAAAKAREKKIGHLEEESKREDQLRKERQLVEKQEKDRLAAEVAQKQKEEGDQQYLTDTDGWLDWMARTAGMTPSRDEERLKERARLEAEASAEASAEKIADEKHDFATLEARDHLVQALTKLLLEGNTPEDVSVKAADAKASAEEKADELLDRKDADARKHLVQALTKLLLEGKTLEEALTDVLTAAVGTCSVPAHITEANCVGNAGTWTKSATENSWLKGGLERKKTEPPETGLKPPKPGDVIQFSESDHDIARVSSERNRVDPWMGDERWVPRHLLKPGDKILLSADGQGEAGKNAWMDATVVKWSSNSSDTNPLKISFVNSGSPDLVYEFVAPTPENIRIAPAKKRAYMRLHGEGEEGIERKIDKWQKAELKRTMQRWNTRLGCRDKADCDLGEVCDQASSTCTPDPAAQPGGMTGPKGGGGRKKKPKRKPSKKKKKSRS